MLRGALDYSRGGYLLPRSVWGEVVDEMVRSQVASHVGEGNIELVSADQADASSVREAARLTGDLGRLSASDLDVLAVALGAGAIIISDDYAIQNVAKHLGLDYITTFHDGIRQERTYVWRCGGCGREGDAPGVCGVCGHELERVSV